MVHETRVIPLDGRPPLGTAIRQYMGEARGRWDGSTLVVETTNFRDEPVYRGSNPARLRLIERFTPIARDKVLWSVTVDDPSTWTRAWTFAMPLTRGEDETIFEYACHEGNRAMANLLSAARTEDEKAGARATSGSRAASPESRVPNPESRVPSPDEARDALSDSRRANPESRVPSAGSLAGEWRIAGAGGRGNFAGYSTPSRLTIRESAADVTIHTDTGTENRMLSATYRLDGTETTVPGPLGWDTRAKAARRDDALVVSITRTIDGPDGTLRFEIQDVYRVSGDVLTLERTQGSQTRRMTYRRNQPVGQRSKGKGQRQRV
jgi:hypothetical protein